MDSAHEVGSRIRCAREAAGFTVATRFAEAVDIKPHTLWRYENGQMTPGTDVLLRIARAAGVSMEWLLTGVGDGPPVPETGGTAEPPKATGTDNR